MYREAWAHIRPLSELTEFEVAQNDPDVRGWDVIGGDNARLGEVDQLLVDEHARKARYLDVKVDSALLDFYETNLHVLIPIGVARVDRANERVRIPAVDAADVRTLPQYTHSPVTRE